MNSFSLFGNVSLFLATALFCQLSAGATVELTEMSPQSGPPGAIVRLSVDGIDPSASSSLTIGGVSAQILTNAGGIVTFRVPSGARSGTVVLASEGQDYELAKPFVVTRMISGTFRPPSQIPIAGYQVLSSQQIFPINSGNGSFTAEVSADRPTLVIAYREIGDPFFLRVLIGSDSESDIDSLSSAVGLAYVANAFFSLPSPVAQQVRNAMMSHSNTVAAASLIEQISRLGFDFTDDQRIKDLVPPVITAGFDALIARVNASNFVHAASLPRSPQGTFLRKVNPPESDHPLGVKQLYDFKLEDDMETPDRYSLTVGVREYRRIPLDAVIEIFSVEPAIFVDGLRSAQTWDGLAPVVFRSNEPLSAGFIRGELLFGSVDAYGSTFDALFAALTDPILPSAPNQFRILKNRRGIYMVQVYTGSSEWARPGVDTQYRILQQNDPRDSFNLAQSPNVTQAGVDAFSGFGGGEGVLGVEAPFVESILKSTIKASSIYNGDSDGPTQEEITDLTKTILNTLAKETGNQLINAGAEAIAARGGAFVLAKHAVKGLSALGRISDAGQFVERSTAIINSRYFAIERALIVVGDPFGSSITGFTPAEGIGGDSVHIYGHNFKTNDLKVSFCEVEDPLADPADLVITASVEAEIVESSPSRIAVLVPADWTNHLSGSRAYICVENGEDKAISAERFSFIQAPRLFSLSAPEVARGEVLTLSGTHFRAGIQIYFTSPGLPQPIILSPQSIEPTNLTVVIRGEASLPPLDYNVSVRFRTLQSAALPLTVGRLSVAPEDLDGGLVLRPRLYNFSNVADTNLSIFEALAIAAGTLGRPAVEIDEEIRDFTGSGYRDIVEILDRGATGVVVPLTREIPPIASGDTISLQRIILDGTGYPGGAGFVFTSSDSRLQSVVIQNLPATAITFGMGNSNRVFNVDVINPGGDGIVLRNCGLGVSARVCAIVDAQGSGLVVDNVSDGFFTDLSISNAVQNGIQVLNGSENNSFLRVSVQNSGETGVLVDGSARFNLFSDTGINGSGLHGVHLRGAGVTHNRFLGPNVSDNLSDRHAVYDLEGHANSSGGWGVLIEDGASFNNIGFQQISHNGLGGVKIEGMAGQVCQGNIIGKLYHTSMRFFGARAILSLLFENEGPGMVIGPGAAESILQGLSIAGNLGDAIRIEGPDSDGCQISQVYTGYRTGLEGQPVVAMPNQGSSVHVIGPVALTRIGLPDELIEHQYRNSFNNDLQNGVFFEGEVSESIIVNTDVGVSGPVAGRPSQFGPIGASGILLRGGPHHNQIGSAVNFVNVRIEACGDAAIRIEGEGSDANRIRGVHIGRLVLSTNDPVCAYGIYLKDGPKKNIIGEPGRIAPFPAEIIIGTHQDEANHIWNTSVAGIVLDNSGGSPIGLDLPDEANLIQNNSLSGNEVGILIQNGAKNNVIGGTRYGPRGFLPLGSLYTEENNQIGGSRYAGIIIRNNVLTNEFDRNRILGNFHLHAGDQWRTIRREDWASARSWNPD